MSTFRSRQLVCPTCATSFPITILKGIHITRLPEVRGAILDGTFHAFACPGCGMRLRVEEPGVVYTDFERGHYVVVEARGASGIPERARAHVQEFEDAFVHAPEIARELGRALVHRLVFGLGALREKLMLWDAGLDDRVVEAIKLDLLGPAATPRDELLRYSATLAPGYLTFVRIAVDPSSRTLDDGSVAIGREEIVGYLTAPRELVEQRVAAADRIAADYPWLADPWIVDAHDGHPDRLAAPPDASQRDPR